MGLAEHRKRIAVMLGLAPDQPDTWPIDLIERLIIVERTASTTSFLIALSSAAKKVA